MIKVGEHYFDVKIPVGCPICSWVSRRDEAQRVPEHELPSDMGERRHVRDLLVERLWSSRPELEDHLARTHGLPY